MAFIKSYSVKSKSPDTMFYSETIPVYRKDDADLYIDGIKSELADLKAKYEKCLLALNKIKNHDGHRHSEDPDDIAMFCLRELGEK